MGVRYRPFLKALYPLAILLMVAGIIDPVIRSWPVQLGDVRWRFGMVGLASLSALQVVFGLLVLMVAAALLDHRKVMRVGAVATLLVGIVTGLVLGFFLLDTLQVRASVNPAVRSGFDITVLRSVIMLGLSVPISLSLGMGAWLSTRGVDPPRARTVSQQGRILLKPKPKGGTIEDVQGESRS